MPPFFPQGFCSCSISIDIRTKATIIGPLVETLQYTRMFSVSLSASTALIILQVLYLASYTRCKQK